MEPASSEAVFEEAPKRPRKKVQLVSLEDAEEAPAPPKKRVRKKLPEEETEPTSVAFTSAKGAVSFSARKKAAKVAEVEAKVAEMEAPPPQPLVRQQAQPPQVRVQPQQVRVQAPPTPGLYDMLHEHLSSRGAERSQRWSQFLVA